MKTLTRRRAAQAGGALLLLAPVAARAEKKYDPGVTDTEIKLGNTSPYSGPVSVYGTMGIAETAYWQMVNDQGGINGRKIKFISYDDGYVPPKTVELVRKMVEDENVFAMFSILGSATNAVVQKYLNQKKVPQLFSSSGASRFGDPANYPWTMGFQPDYATEGEIYARHALTTDKAAKLGILYQNDDAGKDNLAGFKRALKGDEARQLVAAISYEVTDPTLDTQVIQLKGSGATAIFLAAGAKYAAQAIRKIADLGWKPTIYLATASSSVGGVLKPAGLDNSTGILTASYLKDPTDKQWDAAPDMVAWKAWMERYLPKGNQADVLNVTAYAMGSAMRLVLERCGDELTRDNLMRQATSLKKVTIPLLLPGITLNTSPTDYFPIQSARLARFDGETWRLFGELISGDN
ncbi:MAG: ABC transporter substrate-binding protein [Reyranellaceae bacterium]